MSNKIAPLGGTQGRAITGVLQEFRSSRLGDRSQILRQLILGHTDPRIPDDELPTLSVLRLASFDRNVPLPPVEIGERALGQRCESKFLQCVLTVGQELSEENIFLTVKRMNDDRAKLGDIRLEYGIQVSGPCRDSE